MLEDRVKVGSVKAREIYRGVTQVSPYPRINPQHPRQEDQPGSQREKRSEKSGRVNRRFIAMRALVERLMDLAQIVRVDFNTAYQEVCDQGLAVAEEGLIGLLLQLKVPLNSIEQLVQQLREKNSALAPTSGRPLTKTSPLFPVLAPGLAEYSIRFDELQVKLSPQHSEIFAEITANGRFVIEQNQIRLTFRNASSIQATADIPLHLTISILVGAIEINETKRRAILYQRPNKSYGIYSDKSIDLSI